MCKLLPVEKFSRHEDVTYAIHLSVPNMSIISGKMVGISFQNKSATLLRKVSKVGRLRICQLWNFEWSKEESYHFCWETLKSELFLFAP